MKTETEVWYSAYDDSLYLIETLEKPVNGFNYKVTGDDFSFYPKYLWWNKPTADFIFLGEL